MLQLNKIYCIDALEGLKQLETNSINLVCTSPPYANVKKSYFGIKPDKYVEWFIPIGKEIQRILTNDGSFILNINDVCEGGERSIYVHELVVELKKTANLKYFDKLVWIKKNGVPTSGLKRRADYFEYIFHFTKGLNPLFNIDAIREPYSPASIKRSLSPIKTNVSNKEARVKGKSSYKKWVLNEKGRHPNNLIYIKKNSGRESHVAMFHEDLPAHFIKAHTRAPNEVTDLSLDVVLDPFCGSGSTLISAKKLMRNFIGFDNKQEYVELANQLLSKINS